MAIISLSEKDYNEKVAGTPIAVPAIINDRVSELSYWDFIRQGSEHFRNTKPDIYNHINGAKEGETLCQGDI
jgi:hypothetical protein